MTETDCTSRATEARCGELRPHLHFLHHYDRPNVGDVLSGPYRYFKFPDFSKVSWDKNVIAGEPDGVSHGDAIIMGGGIFFTKNKWRLKRIVEKARIFIGWGVGIDARLASDDFPKSFTLLGTRERQSRWIDDKRVFYVPCASCMHEAFDAFAQNEVAEASATRGGGKTRKTLHLNGGFNQRAIVRRFPDLDMTTTVDPFEKIVANLSSADVVITNSYHGAYWSSLMGKRVVCVRTEVPKWEGLSRAVVFSELADVEDATERAGPVSRDYPQECRRLNVEFYEKVIALLAV